MKGAAPIPDDKITGCMVTIMMTKIFVYVA